jgi:transposase-like protein
MEHDLLPMSGGKVGRPSLLNNPEMVQKIAEAFVDGHTRQDMADAFGVKNLHTITRWRRDARVKAIAFKLIEDRVLQVTRKVDFVIADRLSRAEEMTTKELLEIRKEYLGGKLREQHEKADDETIHQAMDWLSDNPEEAAELERILAGEQAHPAAG